MAICPFHQLDRLIDNLLSPKCAIPPTSDEAYRIRRLRMNFRLDIADLRASTYLHSSRGWFGPRGPHLNGLRQILLRVGLQHQLVRLGQPSTSTALWNWLWQLGSSPFGYYTHICNAANNLAPPADATCVRYLPEVFFYKHLGNTFNRATLEIDFRSWLKEDLKHIEIFSGVLGEKVSPRFYTSLSAAPHNVPHLPTHITIGTKAAAEHVVRKLGLPGHENPIIRGQRRGIVAVIIPTSWLVHFGRPTVLEALDKAYFFLAGEKTEDYGRTWPLEANMQRNDRKERIGCLEWAAILDQQKLVADSINLVYIGPLI